MFPIGTSSDTPVTASWEPKDLLSPSAFKAEFMLSASNKLVWQRREIESDQTEHDHGHT